LFSALYILTILLYYTRTYYIIYFELLTSTLWSVVGVWFIKSKKKKRNREYNNRNHPTPLPHASSRQYVKRSNTTKNLHFPSVSITFRCWFFRHLSPSPRLLWAPRTAFSPEHNLKSAGRFRRHCVRFLWRHKTLIDIKPRGYFNFLRLHPPPADPPDPFPSTRFIRLTRYVYTPRRPPRDAASPSRTLPPRTQRHSVIRCPFLSRAHNTFAWVLSCIPTHIFFRFSPIPLVPSPVVRNRFRCVLQCYFQRRFLTILSIRQPLWMWCSAMLV